MDKLKPDQKLAIRTTLFHVRQRFSVPITELSHVFHFMYAHNPLGYRDLREYGRPEVVMRVMPSYLQWKQESQSSIEEHGISTAITLGADREVTEVDDFINCALDALLEEINNPA